MVTAPPSVRRERFILLALTLLALGIRVACARGGLWLDEAWSAVFAREVATPAGVLFGINHDNNHHLNTLWLQLVGIDAPSWAMRAPSIVAGTLAVPVAAAIARPRGRAAAAATALLFAVSPMLVTMGSEARGYAPMVLALLVATLLVDRTLTGDARYHRPVALALCFVLGALVQLTMVFGVIALSGWAALTWWRRTSPREAVRRALALFAGPLVALAIVLAALTGAAWMSPTGFRFGSYDPFTWRAFAGALTGMVGYTIGWPVPTLLLPVAAVALVAVAPRWGATRTGFHALAIVAFPAMLALLRSGNPGYPRYYLLAAVALLLLLGELIGQARHRSARTRGLAAAALGAIVAGSLIRDLDLATDRRGDPAVAVATLATLMPRGTTVLLARPSGRATLLVAAAQRHYPLRFTTRACPAAPFVFADRARGEPAPSGVVRCGVAYRPVAAAEPHGLSGTAWTLYRRTS